MKEEGIHTHIAIKMPEYIIDVDELVYDPVIRLILARFIMKRLLDMDKIIIDFVNNPENEAELMRFAASVVFSKTGRDMNEYSEDLLPLFFEEAVYEDDLL